MADDERDDARSARFQEAPGDHPAFERRSLPDTDDVDESFEDDADRDERPSVLSDTRGLAIAAASFVPTFLFIFFGVPYLLSEPSLATSDEPSTVAAARTPEPESSWLFGNSLSEALRGSPFERLMTLPPPVTSAPPAATPAPPVTAKAPEAKAPETPPMTAKAPETAAAPAPAAPSPPAATAPTTTLSPDKSSPPDALARDAKVPGAPADEARSREHTGEAMPGAGGKVARGSSSTDSTPALPPAPERVPAPERKAVASKPALEPRSTPAPRQAVATPDPPRAQAESRKASGDWTPAAAFADREAATRLASSIERQGYPVEIRQEASSTRPWVVWIGSLPSGGARRR